jgi:hypothetical protein
VGAMTDWLRRAQKLPVWSQGGYGVL